MAKPTKKSETKVTRITASDSAKQSKAPAKADVTTKAKKIDAVEPKKQKRIRAPKAKNPLAPLWRYLKGSWYELRQVRWPDRRATWGMTGALIAFTLFFVVVILLIDAGFNELFKLMLGK